MHARPPHHPGNRLWLLSGTGEGPLLATALLARGWRLRVWVVSDAATRSYPVAPTLELAVGPIGGAQALAEALAQAEAEGERPAWVVDATHPFASRISADLAAACQLRGQPLLRLLRPLLPSGGATLLEDLQALSTIPLAGRSLLLAIGARHLATAMAHSLGSRHHARILPSPSALAQAMAAGLAADRVACLHPSQGGAIEQALCRRWGIEAVLCRRSGGVTEHIWQALSAECGLPLLLLERPPEPPGLECHGLESLLNRLGTPEW
jgi:precorrin-6A/cobalt-precorrin-6A reductase